MSATTDRDGSSPGVRAEGPRCIAIVGPFQSGKTTLLESILARCGGLSRPGSVKGGNSVGDAAPEARAHQMSVEPNVASVDFLGQRFHFIDCPGSVEFMHEMRHVLPAVDAAVVVCEADERKIPALELVLRELEEADIPRFLFLNKIDTATRRVRETLGLLQRASRTPLLLRQIPIWQRGIAVGFIDLALERAFIYREHAPSEIVPLAAEEAGREKEARFSMLETLADHDDALMEDLLGDMEPPQDRIFDDLARELRDRHVVPVLIGAAERGNGVTRLLKALRHEAPGLAETRGRIGVLAEGAPLAQIMKTWHSSHGGKISLARILRGSLGEGDVVTSSAGAEARIAGVLSLKGAEHSRKASAEEGDVVALARLEGVLTGEAIALGKVRAEVISAIAPPEPVHANAVSIRDRKDDVRLASALSRLTEEDPALAVAQLAELNETRLSGQGEMHLRVTLERLAGRFGVAVDQPAAAGGLSRDDPLGGQRARTPSQAERRPWPVRRCRAGDRAAAARGGRAVHRPHQRRRRAQAVHRLGRGGGAGFLPVGTAGLSAARSRGDADGRLLSYGRFLRHGLPPGGEDCDGGSDGAGQAGAAGADPGGRDRDPLGSDVAGLCPGIEPARPDPGL